MPTWISLGLLLGTPGADPAPRLDKGLELRWAGEFSEADFRPGQRSLRVYDVEYRLLVLDATDKGVDFAILGRVTLRKEGIRSVTAVPVVKVELGRLDDRGRVWRTTPAGDAAKAEPRPWPVPVRPGLPTLDAGMFVPADAKLKPGTAWTSAADGQPDCTRASRRSTASAAHCASGRPASARATTGSSPAPTSPSGD